MTEISSFWFDKLKDIIPNHVVTTNIDEMPEEVREYKAQLEGRTMLVKKAKVIMLEAIVRGYITGMLYPAVLCGPLPLIIYDVYRLCLVRVSKVRNCTWDQSCPRSSGI